MGSGSGSPANCTAFARQWGPLQPLRSKVTPTLHSRPPVGRIPGGPAHQRAPGHDPANSSAAAPAAAAASLPLRMHARTQHSSPPHSILAAADSKHTSFTTHPGTTLLSGRDWVKRQVFDMQLRDVSHVFNTQAQCPAVQLRYLARQSYKRRVKPSQG
jgi:hypothetical protein